MRSQKSLLFAIFAKPHHANNVMLIKGIAKFAEERPDCHFKLLTPEMLQNGGFQERYDGILCQIRNDALDALARKSGIPLVDVRNSQPAPGSSIVDSDNVAVGRMAAEHFLERRFTSFAFFGYRDTPYSIQRKEGFFARLADAGFRATAYEADTSKWTSTKSWSLPGFDESRTRDLSPLKKALRKLPRNTAVFCCHDNRAISVLEACRICGIDVPRDIAVLGVDNDFVYGAFSHPRLSSIDPSTEEIGYLAARQVCELAEAPASRRTRRTILIPPKEVVVRESTECYPLDPPWLSDALVYIKRNATRGISAADVFAALNRSHTQVSEAFRTVLRSTVQKEIVAVRMEEAKRLLAAGRMSATDVAQACGFSSLHYFSQAFTTFTGKTPSDYAKA